MRNLLVCIIGLAVLLVAPVEASAELLRSYGFEDWEEGVEGTPATVTITSQVVTPVQVYEPYIATVTHTGHGMVTGDHVYIEDAVEKTYNGYFEITRITDNTYTYYMFGAATSPATGTITATPLELFDPSESTGYVYSCSGDVASQEQLGCLGHKRHTEVIQSWAISEGTWLPHSGDWFFIKNDIDAVSAGGDLVDEYIPLDPAVPGVSWGSDADNCVIGADYNYCAGDDLVFVTDIEAEGELFFSFWYRVNSGYLDTQGSSHKFFYIRGLDEYGSQSDWHQIYFNTTTNSTSPTMSFTELSEGGGGAALATGWACPDMFDGDWHKWSFYVNLASGTVRVWLDEDDETALNSDHEYINPDGPFAGPYGPGTTFTYFMRLKIQGNFGAQQQYSMAAHGIDDIEIWDSMPDAQGSPPQTEWEQGDTEDIVFNASDDTGLDQYKIDMSSDGGSTWPIAIQTLTAWPGVVTGSNPYTYSVDVPCNAGTGTNYLIKVTVEDAADNSDDDENTTAFALVEDATIPTALVSVPESGTTWTIGESYYIVWTADDGCSVDDYKVDLSTDGGSNFNVALQAKTSGDPDTWYWDPVGSYATTEAQIRVTVYDPADNSGYDDTVDFTIAAAGGGWNGFSDPGTAVATLNSGTMTGDFTNDANTAWLESTDSGDHTALTVTYEDDSGDSRYAVIVVDGSGDDEAHGWIRADNGAAGYGSELFTGEDMEDWDEVGDTSDGDPAGDITGWTETNVDIGGDQRLAAETTGSYVNGGTYSAKIWNVGHFGNGHHGIEFTKTSGITTGAQYRIGCYKYFIEGASHGSGGLELRFDNTFNGQDDVKYEDEDSAFEWIEVTTNATGSGFGWGVVYFALEYGKNDILYIDDVSMKRIDDDGVGICGSQDGTDPGEWVFIDGDFDPNDIATIYVYDTD